MTPHRYFTRVRTRTSHGPRLTSTIPPSTLNLPSTVSKAQAEVIKKKPPPKVCKIYESWRVRKKARKDKLAAIEAANFIKDVAHITAERARKTELSARRQGLKPPGTVRLSVNRETLGVSWAVGIGDFGSSILFDSDNKRDAEAAGAIFAETHKKDFEGMSAVSLAMIPIAGSDDSDIDNSECLVPRNFKGYYYNA